MLALLPVLRVLDLIEARDERSDAAVAGVERERPVLRLGRRREPYPLNAPPALMAAEADRPRLALLLVVLLMVFRLPGDAALSGDAAALGVEAEVARRRHDGEAVECLNNQVGRADGEVVLIARIHRGDEPDEPNARIRPSRRRWGRSRGCRRRRGGGWRRGSRWRRGGRVGGVRGGRRGRRRGGRRGGRGGRWRGGRGGGGRVRGLDSRETHGVEIAVLMVRRPHRHAARTIYAHLHGRPAYPRKVGAP